MDTEHGQHGEEFRLVCIPFDVYARLAPRRALVGGNVRFGGPHDLCSIGREDARQNVLARLAVGRRERLTSGSAGPFRPGQGLVRRDAAGERATEGDP